MKPLEVPTTDSGYPTPRDDIPSSSRSISPTSSPDDNQLTSTPIRGNRSKSMKEHFSKFREDLSIIDSTDTVSDPVADNSNCTLSTTPKEFYFLSFPSDAVKSLLKVSKELKAAQRANVSLQEENQSLRDDNESLRIENCSLREESRHFETEKPASPDMSNKENVVIPKLQLHDDNSSEAVSHQEVKHSDQIKKELLSFIKNEQDRTVVEMEMKNMLISSSKQPPKVFTATATIQVDTETIDADVQTENDDAVNVINANLKLEVDQLSSQKEVIEKKNTDLQNRLFDYEKLKAKFEEDEQKLRLDLEKKLKISQEKLGKSETRANELQLRLSKKKKELEEVTAENNRLLEDKDNHDFALVEMKVNGETQKKELETQKKELEEELERLKQNIKDLETELIEEKNSKIQLESDMRQMRQDHETLVDELKKRAEEALERESAALSKAAALEAENKKYEKESKYLTESRQVLLGSESDLKNDVNSLTAKLRQKESQLSVLKVQVSEGEIQCESLEAQVADLQKMNEELNKNKYDSNELLEELKKGKLEIDHLRQQVQMKAKESDEMSRLKEDFEQSTSRETRLKEKLEQAMRKEAESEVRIEELIRSEAAAVTQLNRFKVENSEQKETIETIQQQTVLKDTAILNLEKSLECLHNEFEEFKTHANLQYDQEIFHRDQQIEALRGRLIELETYPGQTISVSRKSASVQTEEIPEEKKATTPVSIVEEQAVSPEVSLVSEASISNQVAQLEEKLSEIVLAMNKVVSTEQENNVSVEYDSPTARTASDVFRKISEFLDKVMHSSLENPEDNEKEVDRLWNALNKDIQHLESVMEAKIERIEKESAKNIRRSEQQSEAKIEELRTELSEMNDLAEQRLNVAEEFKKYYELEEREKEDALLENGRLHELRNGELAESEQLEKSLRERLERAEHTIQRMTREKIQKNEEFEAELEQVTSRLQSVQADCTSKVTKLEKNVRDLKSRRAFDKETMESLVKSCDEFRIYNEYLKTRNKQRQKLLNHVNSVVLKVRELGSSSETRREIVELTDQVHRSGLLNEDSPASMVAGLSNS
ncbi:hypothetical protein CAEBREN_18655 [Caenorhabditis brenneri]|uniref:Uncharacterized protein n=1 Tax=Caenorhabditis brenneri TaxID=135651 RepID=G0MLG1_CAEBE|nr:hypothetical protein CAEBREN_18655 [Caenorhabditis brenneri]